MGGLLFHRPTLGTHFLTRVGVRPKVLQFTFPVDVWEFNLRLDTFRFKLRFGTFKFSLRFEMFKFRLRFDTFYFNLRFDIDGFTLRLFSRHLDFNYVTMSEFNFTTMIGLLLWLISVVLEMHPPLLYYTIEGIVRNFLPLLFYSELLHVFARTDLALFT